MATQYTLTQNGSISKNLLGFTEVKIHNETRKIAFDSEIALNNPGIEHITLQHDWIRQMLNDIGEFDKTNSYPILKFDNSEETPGIWSLWQISARNKFENKVHYQCFFIADNGKQYTAYANDIWNRLVSNEVKFTVESNSDNRINQNIEKELNDSLHTLFQNLEADVLAKMKIKKENRNNSYAFQKSRIEKIGIGNIRNSKLARLEKEHENWMSEFHSNQKIIPGIKQILTIRING
jgi:hypothetical protein